MKLTKQQIDAREYYKKNKDTLLRKHRIYYLENRKKILEQIKGYYAKNKIQIIKRNIKYNTLPERRMYMRMYSKKYYKKNKLLKLRQQKQYRQENIYGGNYLKVLKKYNYICQKCFKKIPEDKLCVHHIDKNGSNQPSRLQNNSLNNLTLLCNVCHIKIHNTGESNGNAKLNEKSILEIRNLYKNCNAINKHKYIAGLFGVCKTTIENIIRNQTWEHIR